MYDHDAASRRATHPDEHNRYGELPLTDGATYTDLPTNHLSYAMAHGLVQDDGAIRYQPAPCGAKQAYTPSMPFFMFPIVQFDTLLLLKRGAPLETFGSDPAYDDLTVGLLCKHEHSNTYLHNRHHCVHYYDADAQLVVDFVSRLALHAHGGARALPQAAPHVIIKCFYSLYPDKPITTLQ